MSLKRHCTTLETRIRTLLGSWRTGIAGWQKTSASPVRRLWLAQTLTSPRTSRSLRQIPPLRPPAQIQHTICPPETLLTATITTGMPRRLEPEPARCLPVTLRQVFVRKAGDCQQTPNSRPSTTIIVVPRQCKVRLPSSCLAAAAAAVPAVRAPTATIGPLRPSRQPTRTTSTWIVLAWIRRIATTCTAVLPCVA